MLLKNLDISERPRPVRFAIGTLIFLAALVLRFATLPVDAHAGFVTFYPAMVLVMYLCGIGPGLWVLLLSTTTVFYVFYPPYWSWIPTTESTVAVLAYVVSSLVIAMVMRTLQDTNKQLADTSSRLERAEARLLGILNEQTDVVMRSDARGTLTFVNNIASRIFGKSAELGIQGRWRDAVHPDDLQHVLAQVSALSSNVPRVRFDCRVRDTAGNARWFEFIDQAFFDAEGRLIEVQAVGRDISERKALDIQLRATEAELRDLYDNAPCGYYSLGPDGRFLRLNAEAERMLGTTAAEVIGLRTPGDFAVGNSRATFEAEFKKVRAGKDLIKYELSIASAQAEVRHVAIVAIAVRDEAGTFVRTRSAMVDVTELRNAQHSLETLVHEQDAMLDNEVVGIVKLRGRVATWVNRAFESMFGYGPGEMRGIPSRVLYPDDESHESFGREAYASLSENGRFRAQQRLVKKSGEPIWVDMNGAMLSEERAESLWLMLDITALKSSEQRMTSMAYHDTLTGLPNRPLLLQLLERALATRERINGEIAICFVDLDGFKPVNDEHGHEAGDIVLKVVGERLSESVRGNDIVARLGGDEFIVAFTYLQNSVIVGDTLSRLMQRLRLPIRLSDGALVSISASVGVAMCPGDAQNVPSLIKRADEAMYHAKGAGRNQVRFYSEISAA